MSLGIFSILSIFRDLAIPLIPSWQPGAHSLSTRSSSYQQQPGQNLCFRRALMALSLGWRASVLLPLNHCGVLLKAVRSSGLPLFPWGHGPGRGTGGSLDPEMKAFLEENTEVTSSGSLTPEIQLRLLTPRCKFWWERADLWPHSDPYWAIYWPGGQALSRYCPN